MIHTDDNRSAGAADSLMGQQVYAVHLSDWVNPSTGRRVKNVVRVFAGGTREAEVLALADWPERHVTGMTALPDGGDCDCWECGLLALD